MAVHYLTDNVAVIFIHAKGGSGTWSIFADKISRNSLQPINGDAKKGATPGNFRFLVYNIRVGSIGEIKTALTIKDRKRLSKSLPT